MRHVDRAGVKTPKVFVGDDSPAERERVRAGAFYLERQTQKDEAAADATSKRKKSFDFGVYSHDEVKAALFTLFAGKCAYCESRYAATQPVDVEHFRPKGGIEDDPTHPGYYWLAADWENLLPSCIDCNRERKQEIPTSEDGSTPAEVSVSGKGNQFPLEHGSPRSRARGDEIRERPLLLDPCRDHPEKELEFTSEGIVRAHRDETGTMSTRAAKSIQVYALNRRGLVHDRLEVLRLLQARMYTIQRLAEVLDRAEDSAVEDLIEDLLSYELAELRKFFAWERAYSVMCQQVITQFLAALTGSQPNVASLVQPNAQL